MQKKSENFQKYIFESKFTLNYSQFLIHKNSIRRLCSELRNHYPKRRVHNIYFDTPDLSLLQSTESGDLQRAKVRLRSYDNDSHGQLEVKKKYGQLVTKDICSEVIKISDLILAQNKIRKFTQTDLQSDLFLATTPVLKNSYLREYFLHPTGIRMTIDYDLQNSGLGPFSKLPSINFSTDIEQIYAVIEFKFLQDLETVFNDLIQDKVQLSRSKMSKYVYGMSLLGF